MWAWHHQRIPARPIATFLTAMAAAVSPAIAQVDQPAEPVGAIGGCGTILSAEDVAAALERAQTGMDQAAVPRGAGTWYVPVALHVVRRNVGTGGLPEPRLATAVADINAAYSSAGIVFYRSGATRYIDSDAFYFHIDTLAEINALRQVDVVAGTVNIYFTEHLEYEFGSLCGIASFTTSAVQGIVMKNACTAVPDNHSTMPHEVGHYFDLYHTHETMFGQECVAGQNCAIAGDLVCDTPADPQLSTGIVDSNCDYTGDEQDPCGQLPYFPLTENLMSYAPPQCRYAFTAQQDARSLSTLENLRPELNRTNAVCSAVTFVVAGVPGGGTGAPNQPFGTMGEGVQAVPAGGCLMIAPGDYAAPPSVVDNPMTLRAPMGLVSIGG